MIDVRKLLRDELEAQEQKLAQIEQAKIECLAHIRAIGDIARAMNDAVRKAKEEAALQDVSSSPAAEEETCPGCESNCHKEEVHADSADFGYPSSNDYRQEIGPVISGHEE